MDAIFSGQIKADGGAGIDRLVFTGSNQAIDLTSLGAGDLTSIEAIDLSGSGANSLLLNVSVVESLSDTTDTLKLNYDADDTINFNDGWIVQRPEIIGGTYQHVVTSANSDARLEITNAFPHQNPVDPLDTNRKDGVGAIDPLLVVNALSRNEGGPLPVPTTAAEIPAFYLDVRADNELTSIDALRIINFLSRNSGGNGESEQQLVVLVNSTDEIDDRDTSGDHPKPAIRERRLRGDSMTQSERGNATFQRILEPIAAESDNPESSGSSDRYITLFGDVR